MFATKTQLTSAQGKAVEWKSDNNKITFDNPQKKLILIQKSKNPKYRT